jgi:hypothetical protein
MVTVTTPTGARPLRSPCGRRPVALVRSLRHAHVRETEHVWRCGCLHSTAHDTETGTAFAPVTVRCDGRPTRTAA